MKAQHNVQRTTLGDLVAAAFARAEVTTADQGSTARAAARYLEAELTRARRLDLIRALVSADRAFSEAIPLRAVRKRPASMPAGVQVPFAAAG